MTRLRSPAREIGLDPVDAPGDVCPGGLGRRSGVSQGGRGEIDRCDLPDATLVSGDAVDVVARLKEESELPLRSHGSLSMNRALMAAGLVDRVQVTLFPVVTGQTALDPISRVRPTSTWSWSRPGRSTVTSKSSRTDPPSIDPGS
jgi:hypothetical protein